MLWSVANNNEFNKIKPEGSTQDHVSENGRNKHGWPSVISVSTGTTAREIPKMAAAPFRLESQEHRPIVSGHYQSRSEEDGPICAPAHSGDNEARLPLPASAANTSTPPQGPTCWKVFRRPRFRCLLGECRRP